MSDRRLIVLAISVLSALLGLVVTAVSAVSLRDPFTVSGEIGARQDVTTELIAAIVVGLALVAGGLTTAAGLVHAQVR